MDRGPSPTRPDRGVAALAVSIAIVAVVVYVNALPGGLVYDDVTIIGRNEVVQSDDAVRAFTTPYHQGLHRAVATGLYRPLAIVTLVANHALHGEAPLGYHVVNVALHAAVSAALVALALALGFTRSEAAAGALLFAVHPVHVEAVAGIAGRADLLAALFFVLGLTVYLRGGGLGRAAVAAALSFLAMLSKEVAVVFPAVVLAYELLLARRAVARETLTRLAIAIAPVALYAALRWGVLGTLVPPRASVTAIENPVVGLDLAHRLATVLSVLGRVVGLLLFPWRLSPDYGFAEIVPVTSVLDPGFIVGAVCAAILAAVLGLAIRRAPRVAFLLLMSVACYAVVSNAFVIIGTILGERLLYLPSVGACLIAGVGWGRLRAVGGGRPAMVLAAVVLVLASLRTWTGSAAWRSDLTLFTMAARSAPRSVRVLGSLGTQLALQGRFPEAREWLERAIAIAPEFAPNRITLAGVLLHEGRLEEAEQEARAAVGFDPENPIPHAQLGMVLRKRGDEQGAQQAFEAALAVDPSFVDAHLNLAEIHFGRGDLDAAERSIAAALEADPASEGALRGREILRSLRAAQGSAE